MNRIYSDPSNYNFLRALDEYVRKNNLSIKDSSMDDAFIVYIKESINKNRTLQNLVHGLRIQSLFAFVAASLVKCLLIKEEDVGDVYSKSTDIKRPDFHLILESGEHLFVEVKNIHRVNPETPFRLKKKYLNSLYAYSKLYNSNLKFAIYWSKWRLWTLVDPVNFKESGENKYINLLQASEFNEMFLLGDWLIGTIPPLSIKVETDTMEMKGDKSFVVKITNAYMKANGERIMDKTERQIASFLLFYGQWNKIEESAEVADSKIVSFEIQAFPEAPVPDQAFQMIGYLSQMITNQFNLMTIDNGNVKYIGTSAQPTNIRELIPDNFTGNILELWRFSLRPKNYDFENENY